MSLDYVQNAMAPVMGSTLAIFAAVFTLPIKAPVNAPGIVTITDTGFRVSVNQMESGKFYMVEFMDARYLIWKNKDNALVITEVS